VVVVLAGLATSVRDRVDCDEDMLGEVHLAQVADGGAGIFNDIMQPGDDDDVHARAVAFQLRDYAFNVLDVEFAVVRVLVRAVSLAGDVFSQCFHPREVHDAHPSRRSMRKAILATSVSQ
jgi:hypothetical protein